MYYLEKFRSFCNRFFFSSLRKLLSNTEKEPKVTREKDEKKQDATCDYLSLNEDEKLLIFIRHGESLYNEWFKTAFKSCNFVELLHYDPEIEDAPLSAEGIKQAHHLADFIQKNDLIEKLGINLVISSPLLRAVHTAHILFSPLSSQDKRESVSSMILCEAKPRCCKTNNTNDCSLNDTESLYCLKKSVFDNKKLGDSNGKNLCNQVYNDISNSSSCDFRITNNALNTNLLTWKKDKVIILPCVTERILTKSDLGTQKSLYFHKFEKFFKHSSVDFMKFLKSEFWWDFNTKNGAGSQTKEEMEERAKIQWEQQLNSCATTFHSSNFNKNKNSTHFYANFNSKIKYFFSQKIPFEPVATFARRIFFFKMFLQARKEKVICVVGHSLFFKKFVNESFFHKKMKNCEIRAYAFNTINFKTKRLHIF